MLVSTKNALKNHFSIAIHNLLTNRNTLIFVMIFLLSGKYSYSVAEDSDLPIKNGWSRRDLLYNIEQFQKKYPQCTLDYKHSDSLYYVGWFGWLKTLNGNSLGQLAIKDELNSFFRDISCNYLNDSSLIKDMEFNLSQALKYENKATSYVCASMGLIGGGVTLILCGLLNDLGGNGEATTPLFIISGISIAGGLIVWPFYLYNAGKEIGCLFRLKKGGTEIINSANLKFLKNYCDR